MRSFGLLLCSLALCPGLAAAQSHVETKRFAFDLLPNDVAANALACQAGELLSGGYSVETQSRHVTLDSMGPASYSGIPQWRVDVRNRDVMRHAGSYSIRVLCSGMAATATKTGVPGRIALSQVTQSVATVQGPRDVLDIFAVAPDGSNLQRLTTAPANVQADSAAPAISPDGSRILFMTTRDDPGGTTEIYAMSAQGEQTGLVRLTNNGTLDDSPRWCGPDGGRFVYAREGPDGMDIAEMGATDADGDGNGDYQAVIVGGAIDEYDPDCSPDGLRIVFVRQRSPGDRAVIVANRDGSAEVELSGPPAVNETPRFSPDGQEIVFASNRGDPTGDGRDLYIMRAEDVDGDGIGDSLRRLTLSPPGTAAASLPGWSPDNTHLVYSTNVSGQSSLRIVDRFGAIDVELALGSADAFAGDWR